MLRQFHFVQRSDLQRNFWSLLADETQNLERKTILPDISRTSAIYSFCYFPSFSSTVTKCCIANSKIPSNLKTKSKSWFLDTSSWWQCHYLKNEHRSTMYFWIWKWHTFPLIFLFKPLNRHIMPEPSTLVPALTACFSFHTARSNAIKSKSWSDDHFWIWCSIGHSKQKCMFKAMVWNRFCHSFWWRESLELIKHLSARALWSVLSPSLQLGVIA